MADTEELLDVASAEIYAQMQSPNLLVYLLLPRCQLSPLVIGTQVLTVFGDHLPPPGVQSEVPRELLSFARQS